jgi:DNA-binding MarR family transcriptional regulator
MARKTEWDIVPIRKEYVLLTGNHISALLLNQFLYWTDKGIPNDLEYFLKEEIQYFGNACEDARTTEHGWIYKSVRDLKEELMLDISQDTISKKIDILIDKGFLYREKNERYHLYKYRVNLFAILSGLLNLSITTKKGDKLDYDPVQFLNLYPSISGEWLENLSTEQLDEIKSNRVFLAIKNTFRYIKIYSEPSGIYPSHQECIPSHQESYTETTSQTISQTTKKTTADNPAKAGRQEEKIIQLLRKNNNLEDNSLRTSSPTANNDLPADPAVPPPVTDDLVTCPTCGCQLAADRAVCPSCKGSMLAVCL